VTPLLRRWTPGLFDRRGVLLAELDTAGPMDGTALTVLVTHLPLRRAVRLAQTGTILSLLPEPESPLLLMGDFNEGPQGAAVSRLRDAGLEDHSGNAPTFPSIRPVGKIDYILGAGPLRPLTSPRVIPSPASDHLPVVVDIEVLSPGETNPAASTS
jgi:endonuclease/exonuclease/phosphatase family metal-dependent hydrolase